MRTRLGTSGARRRRVGGGAVVAAVLLAGGFLASPALAREDRVFIIGNYPVEARAANAVAAKEKAIAEGQQAAFRSLLKRLVPVTAYKRLGRLKGTRTSDLIESFAVRSERNSSTDYIASYDFVFSPEPVRRLLEREGLPYLDRQAPPVTLVPAYVIAPELAAQMPQTFSAAAGADAWLYAWKALDLANALAPVNLQPLKREVHADTVRALAAGDLSFLRTLSQAYGSETTVLAVLEPDADQKRLSVVLVGRDAVQNLYLKRRYRLEGLDLAYTAEAAAVVSLSILEGRWKAINVRESAPVADMARPGPVAEQPPPIARPEPVTGGGPMTIAVAFRGMGEWQEISRQLARTPDVEGLEVLGLSSSRARVSLSYPGGPQNLAVALASQGLILESTREGWLLTRR